MPHQHPGRIDQPFLRGPDAAAADDPGKPVRPPYGAGIAAAGHRCR